ncbi:unnamed protein product, partial [Gulo gulo]
MGKMSFPKRRSLSSLDRAFPVMFFRTFRAPGFWPALPGARRKFHPLEPENEFGREQGVSSAGLPRGVSGSGTESPLPSPALSWPLQIP